MKLDDFFTALDCDKEISHHPGSYEEEDGYFVKSTKWDTITFFSKEAIEEHELPKLLVCIEHGKNIDYITRITGYFSRASAWNPGKKGELADRHKNLNW